MTARAHGDWEAHVFHTNSGDTAVFLLRNLGDHTEYVTGTDEFGGLTIERRENDPRSPDEDLSFFRLSFMHHPRTQGLLPALAAAINQHTQPSEAAELAAAEARVTVLNSALDRERARVDNTLNTLLISHVERTTP